MNIEVPLKILGPINPQPLINAMKGATDEDWLKNQLRQKKFKVHSQTQSLVMNFTEFYGWPSIKVTREPGYDILASAAQPLIDDIIERYYERGGIVIRAMAAKLPAGACIRPHYDAHESFVVSHRIHIPLITNDDVVFEIDNQPNHLEVGNIYEVNNQLKHSVVNHGTEDRVTFIFDYIPPSAMGNLELIA